MDPKRVVDKPQVLDNLTPDLGAKLVEAVRVDMERAKREKEEKAAKKKRR